MFLSYKIIGKKHKNGPCVFELIDSDFTVELQVIEGYLSDFIIEILLEYHKRNLNVAKNYYLLLRFVKEQDKYWNWNSLMNYCDESLICSNKFNLKVDCHGLITKSNDYLNLL